jgi:hypothetical protein
VLAGLRQRFLRLAKLFILHFQLDALDLKLFYQVRDILAPH